MRYLRTYEGYNDDLVNECSDILLGLKDDGVDYRVIIEPEILISGKVEILLKVVVGMVNYPYGKNMAFRPFNYIDSFDHLNSFLESKGWKFFANGTHYSNWEKRMAAFEGNGLLQLMIINYKKE
jgi:hypothetical protein